METKPITSEKHGELVYEYCATHQGTEPPTHHNCGRIRVKETGTALTDSEVWEVLQELTHPPAPGDEWTLVSPDTHPDPDYSLLLAANDGEVGEGLWDGETWYWADGREITAGVKYWQHMLIHPENVE